MSLKFKLKRNKMIKQQQQMIKSKIDKKRAALVYLRKNINKSLYFKKVNNS